MSETNLALERNQKGDSLGDRMKGNYENRYRHTLLRRTPVIVRVDGRAFHTLTAAMDRPFDPKFAHAMVMGARETAREMQGFKLGYVQSDEASFFLTDYDELNTEAWFGYVKSKVETITSSAMSLGFNSLRPNGLERGLFDARSFNVPREEVSNYFLWRAKDWERNSVAMYCQSFFSAKELHGQGRADQHEMLHRIGKNWTTDVAELFRNGCFILRDLSVRTDILPRFDQIDALVSQQLQPIVPEVPDAG